MIRSTSAMSDRSTPHKSRRALSALLVAGFALAVAIAGVGCSSGSATGDVSGSTTPLDSANPLEPAFDDDQGDNDAEQDQAAPVGDGIYPDVLEATATQSGSGSWTFTVTMSSPYDTPERYADAWRVVGSDGGVYGERILGHDHANEQPFTRSQSGIVIPFEITTVTVEGRDQLNGWGGATVDLELVP